MSKTVTFTAVGMGTVPRGLRLILQDGRQYIVTKQDGYVLTLVPLRWWHRVPWLWVLAFGAGSVLGQLLWRFW